MSVIASPVTLRYSVADADDPYKKYWWAILLGFAGTTLWLLSPMLGETSIGSTRVDLGASKNDAGVEQSLEDSESAGGAGLAMDGSAKKEGAAAVSGLYQPPPEAVAGAAPAQAAAPGSASGRTLADELKKVGASGWNEKAQRGFSSPKLSGGSMSGLGSTSGGHAGSASSVGAFGARNAQVGFAATKNITDAPAAGGAGVKGMAGLKSAAVSAQLAAGNTSGDASASSLSRIFDGAKAQNKIDGPGGAVLNGAYEALDAAPVNLKLNDPKLDEKKLTPPPATQAPASANDDAEFAKQLALSMAGSLIGGVIGGPAGAAVAQVAQQAIQRQMDQERKVRELEQKQQMDGARARMGLSVTKQ